MFLLVLLGAQRGTRTPTSFRTLRPERSASTNSAIWALLTTLKLGGDGWIRTTASLGAWFTARCNQPLCHVPVNLGAQSGTRTRTTFRPLASEASTSTNFITWARFLLLHKYSIVVLYSPVGGGGEIRTHGPGSQSPVFKAGAIDHSATPPRCHF